MSLGTIFATDKDKVTVPRYFSRKVYTLVEAIHEDRLHQQHEVVKIPSTSTVKLLLCPPTSIFCSRGGATKYRGRSYQAIKKCRNTYLAAQSGLVKLFLKKGASIQATNKYNTHCIVLHGMVLLVL